MIAWTIKNLVAFTSLVTESSFEKNIRHIRNCSKKKHCDHKTIIWISQIDYCYKQ